MGCKRIKWDHLGNFAETLPQLPDSVFHPPCYAPSNMGKIIIILLLQWRFSGPLQALHMTTDNPKHLSALASR